MFRYSTQNELFVNKLIESVKNCAPQPTSDQRLCQISRFNDNKSVYDPKFDTYNAVSIPGSEWVLAEGPNHASIDSTALIRFYQNTLHNQAMPISLFFVVGKPNEAGRPGFSNYFSQPHNSTRIKLEQVLTLLCHNTNLAPEVQQAVLAAFQGKETDLYFHLFNQEGKVGLVIHLENWPDRGVMSLDEGSVQFLLLLSSLRPRMLLHCAAGIGRSVTVLLAMLGFQARLDQLVDDDLIDGYCSIVRKLRMCKPGVLPDPEQWLLALEWIAHMGSLYSSKHALFSAIASCNSLLLELPQQQLMACYFEARLNKPESRSGLIMSTRGLTKRDSGLLDSSGSSDDEVVGSASSGSRWPSLSHSMQFPLQAAPRSPSLAALPHSFVATGSGRSELTRSACFPRCGLSGSQEMQISQELSRSSSPSLKTS